MKRIIIALMVAVTFCSLAMAQNPTITQDNKNSSDSTIVTEYTDIVDSSTAVSYTHLTLPTTSRV